MTLIDNYRKISAYRYFFESYMRGFIKEKLEGKFNENWWEKGIPEDIKTKCIELKKKDLRLKEKPDDDPEILIEKVDFSHYSKIINANWAEIFRKEYEGQRNTWVEAKFKELNLITTAKFEELKPIRDAEAHSVTVVPISDNEVEIFKVNVQSLLCDEISKGEFKELVRSLEKPITPPLKSAEEKIKENGFDLLNNELFERERNKRSTFIDGGEPTWMDIIGNNAIKRSLLDDVKQIIDENKENIPFLLPIVGGAGEGKTTLLRQIGYALYQQGETVLFYKLSRESINIHFLVEVNEVISKDQDDRKILFVLIDDLFKINDMEFLLKNIKSYDLPIIVIGTSRPNKFSIGKSKIEERKTISCIPEEGFALKVSEGDIGRIRKKVFEEMKASNRLSEKERERVVTLLKEDKPLLALMLELRTGEGFQKIIENEVTELKEYGQIYYDSYRYVIATQSLGSWLPISLLETLLKTQTNNVYRVLNDSVCQGLIFRTDVEGLTLKKALKARHELIAQASLRPMFHLDRGVDELTTEYINMINAINTDDQHEIGEVSYWLRYLSERSREDEDIQYRFPISYDERKKIVHTILQKCSQKIEEIKEKTHILDLVSGWSKIYRDLEMYEEMERSFGLAMMKRVTKPKEINEIFGLVEETWNKYGFYPLQRKLGKFPNNVWLNSIYLKRLIESYRSCKNELSKDKVKTTISQFMDSLPETIKSNEFVLLMYASHLVDVGEIDAALEMFDRISQANPQNIVAKQKYIDVLDRQGNYQKELAEIEEYINKFGEKGLSQDICNRHIWLLTQQKVQSLDEIIIKTQAYVLKYPDDVGLANQRIYLLGLKGDVEGRMLEARRILRYVPKYTEQFLFNTYDGKLVNALTKGFVPEKLKDIFQQSGLPLPKNIFALKVKDREWLITNTRVFSVRKEGEKLNAYAGKQLDRLFLELTDGARIINDLNKGLVSRKLIAIFRASKCALSQNAFIIKINEYEWLIVSGKGFIIKKGRTKLNVYKQLELNHQYIELLGNYSNLLIGRYDTPSQDAEMISRLLEYVKFLRTRDNIRQESKAKKFISRLLECNPDNSNILEVFISILEEEREKEDSDGLQDELIELYGKLGGIKPIDIASRNKYAYLLYLSRNRNPQHRLEAIKQYETLVENGQREHNHLGNLYKEYGVELREAGSLEAAAEYIDKAEYNLKLGLEELPRKEKAYNDLGLLYLEKRDIPNAIHSFLKALEHNPRYVWANYSLGKTYEDMGNPEAGRYYKAAIEFKPEDIPDEQIQRAYDYLSRLGGTFLRWPRVREG